MHSNQQPGPTCVVAGELRPRQLPSGKAKQALVARRQGRWSAGHRSQPFSNYHDLIYGILNAMLLFQQQLAGNTVWVQGYSGAKYSVVYFDTSAKTGCETESTSKLASLIPKRPLQMKLRNSDISWSSRAAQVFSLESGSVVLKRRSPPTRSTSSSCWGDFVTHTRSLIELLNDSVKLSWE